MDKDATLTVTAGCQDVTEAVSFACKIPPIHLGRLGFQKKPVDSEFNNFFSFKRKPSTKNPFFSPPHHGWDAPGVTGEAESG